ncbi:MAG: DUF4145 domain-containing protein, partial [Planctomycetes bacterium]|nr:DUF4145 domain-containing protein [Planctomycetota bacterium]
PDDVASVYEEARCAYSAEAFTGAVILCRKLLMNIAVQKGADSDNTFKGYVDHLETKHYTPPDSGVWIDKIRSLGNEANHELRVMSQEDAELAIEFSEMLLRFIFEYPGRANASGTEGS